MKKICLAVLSLLLMLGMSGALADVNPNQMGAQGGANIPNVTNQIPPQISAPVVESNGDDYGSYLPSGNEDVPSGYYAPSGDPFTSLPMDWVDINQVPPVGGEGFTSGGAFVTEGDTATGASNAAAPATGGTQSLDWYGAGFDLINKNKNITIYDINTGVTWAAKYINGKNHADVVPASLADAQKLVSNKITGDYKRRPVVVTIAGTNYAGSMYAVGHGETSYCDYFTGVMCIHFTGSQTHGSQKVDTDHQNAINEALQYGN